MMKFFYRNRRSIAIALTLIFVFQIFGAQTTYALTSGPTQPEVQSFQPAGTTEMVDLFTGDFSYNIPLFELPGPNGGYPFNLSYQAGQGMDSEASWVGLGWSLNPGAINRQIRGLPDEFKGDKIHTKMDINPSVTFGLGAGVSLEVFGADKLKGITPKGESTLKGTAGLSVSYNNYRGFGYSIDGNVGFKKASESGMTHGVGLGLKLDSNEGISMNPSLSLGGRLGEFGVNSPYNSKAGLHAVSFTHSYTKEFTIKDKDKKKVKFEAKMNTSSTLTLAHPGYTPQITMPMKNIGLSAHFSPGGDWWGIFAKGYIKGFYNEQKLQHKAKRISSEAYGYMNYQYAQGSSALMDINREKDGIVSKESPNLPIPLQTYDIYSATGQGISAMYRPMRNDYGMIHDPKNESISEGVGVGVDVGPTATKVGVNINLNHAKSVSGAWTNDNDMASRAAFDHKSINDSFEPWHFKVHGEMSAEKSDRLDDVGGSDPVRVQLTGLNILAKASTMLEGKGSPVQLPDITNEEYRERKSRNQVIQPFTREQLVASDKEMISYFKVRYIDSDGNEKAFDRNGHPGHHTTAFTALTPDGLRYNYGIPAYNLHQEEVTYSAQPASQSTRVSVGNGGGGDPSYKHDNTDKFLKKVEMPKYAHAYLLTSIVGPDYVDVTNDGVTQDDLGYWVKFTYKKTTTDANRYKWRDPFSKAHYIEGWKTDPRDDKGTYTYGEKEMWYLAKAETKSHIAVFSLEARKDGKGVSSNLQDSNNTGMPVYKLAEIKLYTRSAGTGHPIKTVKFDYDYSLCKEVFNNDDAIVSDTTGGKLTLKKLWFEYGGSQRGSFNPYTFNYRENDPTYNPNYDQNAYDRWGNYKPYPPNDPLHNTEFPYVSQDAAQKEALDRYASSWSLAEIGLPSGGKIKIDYESDDYGYVQNLPAMQMMEMVDSNGDAGDVGNGESFTIDDNAKIRFKLEYPIEGTLNDVAQKAEVLKYLDQKREQIYFKSKINLRSDSENFFEFISGYADINFSAGMGLEKDASNKYAYGYFHLVKEKANGKHYNPISLRAWQHIRTNQPELANTGKKFKPANSTGEKVDQIRSLGSVFVQLRQMFEGFYKFCDDKGWGREIESGKSWIRLNSPDKIKYGGGLRVRQITMTDNWSEDSDGVYGQVYEYTTEEKGKIISSGVAAYEPIVGGEENPLRYAKKYTQSVPLRADNNLFFEFPVNESCYPGPQVGYGKVTVTSLPAAYRAGKQVKHVDGLFPQGDETGYGTTGQTIHEFYTAKDFPVITDETDKKDKPYNLSVPVPFLGNVSISKLTSSQGYSIITNDMHGRPSKISNYRQDKTGHFEVQPISWVKYNYLAETRHYQGQKISSVANQFVDNGDGTLSIADSGNPAEKYSIGEETEFFIDMREFQDNAWEGGGSGDLDVVYIFVLFGIVPIPIPTMWPSVSKSQSTLRTAVTNKIIFRSGILESTEAYDGGSRVVTENLKWDKQTGVPVLTYVNNNFDAPIYSYTIPAYSKYQGMGAAYRNIGLTFEIEDVDNLPYHDNFYQFSLKESSVLSELFPGDEILLYNSESEFKSPVAKVIFTGEENGDRLLYSSVALTGTSYKAMVVRSGYRNQLSVSAGGITALDDPSVPGTPVTYGKTITIPKDN